MPVSLHGKDYRMVHERMSDFRTSDDWAGWNISADIDTTLSPNPEHFVVFRAVITDPDGNVRAVGHASERFGTTNVNTGSHIENCETSAYGRALAFLHPQLAGDSIASADEIANQMTTHDVYAELLLLMLIGTQDPQTMLKAFIRFKDLDDEMKAAVFNHAPQGLKGKWKDFLRSLEKQGHATINERAQALKAAWETPEDLFDVWNDCTQYEKEALEMLVFEQEHIDYLNSLTGAADE